LRVGECGVDVGNRLARDAANQFTVDRRMNGDVARFREVGNAELGENGRCFHD